MEIVEATQIYNFGITSPKAEVSPVEEPIFVLTSSQLQEIISKAVQPFQDKVMELKDIVANLEGKVSALEATADTQADNELNMLRLINDLRKKEPGKTEISRVEKIEKYLDARPDHKASFETLKGHLGVTKNRLNEAISLLLETHPGQYGISTESRDKRKRVLVLLPKLL